MKKNNSIIKSKLERKLEVFEKFILGNSMDGVYRNTLLNVLTGLKNNKDLDKNILDSNFEDFVKNIVQKNEDRDHWKVRYYNS